MAELYPALLDAAEPSVASVPWDLSRTVHQEPTTFSSLGSGEVAPGLLLHSGEMTHAATDLYLRGRGIDFAFTRVYRSQAVGNGPLGPGWDHVYRQRLRELPNGDVLRWAGTRGAVHAGGDGWRRPQLRAAAGTLRKLAA